MSKLGGWRVLALLLALAAAYQGGSAARIGAKALLAQALLARAWQQSQGGLHPVPPWGWADTWPAARLVLPRQHYRQLVLAGASARNLAFGPAHVDGSGWPGERRPALIAGHRDTHFAVLEDVRIGDPVRLERGGRHHAYRVTATLVVHASDAAAIARALEEGAGLALVTCHPFHALRPGGEWRYVVIAKPVGEPAAAPAPAGQPRAPDRRA